MSMTPNEFEKYLEGLNDEQYDALIVERMANLNDEQKIIVVAREQRRKERRNLYHKLNDPDPKVRDEVFALLVRGEGDACEHERSWVKHCLACGQIDHAMFPELFDSDGFPLNEEE